MPTLETRQFFFQLMSPDGDDCSSHSVYVLLSECGTWSHAVIPSLGARARGGGGAAPMFQCCTLSDPIRGQALWVGLGPVGSQDSTSGSRMFPYGSVYQSYTGFVYQSYTDTEQLSDPSGLVGSCRARSGSDGSPSEH